MEAVDRSYGEALTARAAALGGVRGIGPPDLCYLKRRSRPVLGRTGQRLIGSTLGRISASAADALGGGGQVDGFYHHVLGVSAVSLATISAYLAELAQTDATSGWASSREVIGAVYCCWDAFGRQDLRVHLSIPGGVRAFVVRPDGTYTSETPPPDMWRSIGVSALLRAYCTPPSGLPCVRVHRTSLSSEGGGARGAPWEVCESVYRLVAAHGLQAARFNGIHGDIIRQMARAESESECFVGPAGGACGAREGFGRAARRDERDLP